MDELQTNVDRIIKVLGRPVARRFPITHFPILVAVLRAPRPVSVMGIVRSLRVDYDDVQAVLRHAKRLKWVTVEPLDEDRRVKRIELTAKGEAARRQLEGSA